MDREEVLLLKSHLIWLKAPPNTFQEVLQIMHAIAIYLMKTTSLHFTVFSICLSFGFLFSPLEMYSLLCLRLAHEGGFCASRHWSLRPYERELTSLRG